MYETINWMICQIYKYINAINWLKQLLSVVNIIIGALVNTWIFKYHFNEIISDAETIQSI